MTNQGKETRPFSKFPTYMLVGLVTRPTALVFSQDLPDADALFAPARDTGAELVRIDSQTSDEQLSEQLETALRVGRVRQGQ